MGVSRKKRVWLTAVRQTSSGGLVDFLFNTLPIPLEKNHDRNQNRQTR